SGTPTIVLQVAVTQSSQEVVFVSCQISFFEFLRTAPKRESVEGFRLLLFLRAGLVESQTRQCLPARSNRSRASFRSFLGPLHNELRPAGAPPVVPPRIGRSFRLVPTSGRLHLELEEHRNVKPADS